MTTTEAFRHDIQILVEAKDLRAVRARLIDLAPVDAAELIDGLTAQEQAIVFRILPRDLATKTFEHLALESQERLLTTLGDARFAVILNEMAPDDRTALLEEFPAQASRKLLALLSKEERQVALTLLGYPEGSVGRLMSPDYIAVEETWTVDDVLKFIRAHGADSDTLNVIYVVDKNGRLIDELRLRSILLSSPETGVGELMNRVFVALHATDDQEVAVGMFKKYDYVALPVIDSLGFILGVVTVDDVLDVAEEEATEDIQKIGGMEALGEPYIKLSVGELIRKRAIWLVVLFLGEMLTATAMGFYEEQIKRQVMLALFIPLIISSGGNSGSQASTLVIRALAIGEITLRDWWRVLRREFVAGGALGLILGTLGFVRIYFAPVLGESGHGEEWAHMAVAVGLSLVAVVLWGVLMGSMLPLLLKRLGADPATSSAPFVATAVDVTGLVIYFTIASSILRHHL
jgi:magnesium transporter